jgi:hypothetical protein
VRLNRKEVPKSLKQKIDKGDVRWRIRDSLLAINFMDKKSVSFLTTAHAPVLEMLGKVNRNGEPIVKPQCVVDYNKSMGGVDKNDQMSKYYTVTRKCSKWWRKVYFHMLNLSITNSYLLHRKYSAVKLSHHDFRKSLALSLVTRGKTEKAVFDQAPANGEAVPQPGPGGDHAAPVIGVASTHDRLTGRHFPELLPLNERGDHRLRRRCKVCYFNGKRTDTNLYCPDCDVPLCAAPCFRTYHTSAEEFIR